jgi:hypothetical protein
MPWAKKSLSIKIQMLDAQVLGASVSGYLTLASSALMRDYVNAELLAAGAKSVVVDLRKAVHVLSEDDWRKIVEGSDLAFPSPVPVALVVSEADEAAVRKMADAMLDVGHLRGVFLRPGPALQWAKDWAGTWALTRP